MQNQKFEWEFTVLETHLDTFGHMNHATYLTIFEQARWELIEDRGYGLKKILETQIGPTILELKIRYMRELTLRERVKVVTQPLDFKSKIGTIKQQMLKTSGDVAAEIELVVGLFDMRRRKLIDATPEWLHAIGVE